MWAIAQVFTSDWVAEMVSHVPVLVLRTIITFVLVLVVVRWTGKRSVANLAPFDLSLVILIGEVAAIPVVDLDLDFLHGLIPVALLGALHVLMTTVNMHWRAFEDWTEGRATLLVKDGKVLRKNLLKERVSMIDLETALRHKDVDDVFLVKEAWMEPAGGISVILKPRDDAATVRDLDQAIEKIVQANSARMRRELELLFREHRGSPGG